MAPVERHGSLEDLADVRRRRGRRRVEQAVFALGRMSQQTLNARVMTRVRVFFAPLELRRSMSTAARKTWVEPTFSPAVGMVAVKGALRSRRMRLLSREKSM